MALNQPALVAITPQTPHQNGNSFIKNITTRSSFCGTPTNHNKSFLTNRKSWNGNGTLPLQASNNNIDIISPVDKNPPQPILATFKSTGTFPRKNCSYQLDGDQRNYFDGTSPCKEGGDVLTPNGNSSSAVVLPGSTGNDTRRSSGSGRRYAEIGNWSAPSSNRGSFLESHIKGVGWRSVADDQRALDDQSTEDDEHHLLNEERVNSKRQFVLHGNQNDEKVKTERLRDRFEVSGRDDTDGQRSQGLESRFHEEARNRVAKEMLEKSRNSDEWRKDVAGSSGFRPIPESELSLSQSRDSLSSRNSCGGSDADGDCSSDSSSDGDATRSHNTGGTGSEERPACDIGVVERLIRTHAVWFLPGIQRAGAFHLLQGKEEGNFIVRQSSQADTMALSVRLPVRAGPYIEHYLIHAAGGRIGLETSQNKFDNIPDLIAYYSQCCDELPVQLVLPRALREAKNRQQLSSLALLGQEFWRYPMANPKQNPNGMTPELPMRTLPVPTPMSQTPSDSGSSLSSFSHNTGNHKLHIPSINEHNDSNVVLNLTPLDHSCGSQSNSGACSMSTFKRQGSSPPNFAAPRLPGSMNPEGFVRAPRPTPPNTLNLLSSTANLTQQQSNQNTTSTCNQTSINSHSCVQQQQATNNNNVNSLSSNSLTLSRNIPPPPPPRWAKPTAICTPCTDVQTFSPMSKSHNSANIVVTTTVTVSVSNQQQQQQSCKELEEFLSPLSPSEANSFSNNTSNINNSFDNGLNIFNHVSQTISKRLSPEGECMSNNSTSSSIQNSLRRRQKTLQDSCISSSSPTTTGQTFSPEPNNKTQIVSPNSTNSATSGIFSPSQINSPLSNATISLKSGIFSPVSQIASPALNKSELFSPTSRSSPLSTKSSVFSPVSNQNSFTNNSSSAFNSPLMGKERLLSPHATTPSTTHSGRSRRKHSTRKESQHYQESDILETSDKFYRSSLGDKVSDYEDIWGPEGHACTPQETIHSNGDTTNTNTGSSKGSTFKQSLDPLGSGILISKRPDLLPDTLPKVTSLNNNVLSPDSPPTTDNDSDKELRHFTQNGGQQKPGSSDQINNMVIATTNSKGEPVAKRPDRLNLLKNANEQLNLETSEMLNKQKEINNLSSCTEDEIEKDNHKKTLNNEECLLLNSDFCNSADEDLCTDKQSSPFYADPVDALKEAVAPLVQRRRPGRGITVVGPAQRYSEPPSHGHPYLPLRDMHSIEELSPSSPNTSSSVDNLVGIKGGRPRGKAVQPPKIKPTPVRPHDQIWTVDSSWEFINKQSDSTPCRDPTREAIVGSSTGGAFPSLAEQQSQLEATSSSGDVLTIHQVLAQRFPELHLTPYPTLLKSSGETDTSYDEVVERKGCRMSSYDNVENRLAVASSQASDDGTVFSEPWDCTNWDTYLPQAQSSIDDPISIHSISCDDDETSTARESSVTPVVGESPLRLATISRARSFRDRLDPLLAPPRIQALRGPRSQPGKTATTPDDAIRAYALHLAADKTTIFAQNVENFIQCTKDSKETCPHVVMRNMRQFMSGMKNYLVKHGEREFEKEVEKARMMLKPNEFLNLDAILEDVLYSAVVTPLRSHVYSLLADKYVKSGDVAQLDAGMKICRALPPLRIGIKPHTRVPRDDEMIFISNSFLKMQEAESPSHKMEHLLAAISGIFQAMKSDPGEAYQGPLNRNIGADDFLPYLVYCLARCSLPGAELEAVLMDGLLPPRMLSGEGGYYLTTLFGAVAILKQLAPSEDSKKVDWQTGSLGSSMIPSPASTPCSSGGVAKVLVPDECSGALKCLSLPWRAGSKAKDICRVLAHRARITDAQDYGLFVLRDGEETLINDTDCPQDIIDQNKCNCMFAYKRIDAKIAWPKQALNSYP